MSRTNACRSLLQFGDNSSKASIDYEIFNLIGMDRRVNILHFLGQSATTTEHSQKLFRYCLNQILVAATTSGTTLSYRNLIQIDVERHLHVSFSEAKLIDKIIKAVMSNSAHIHNVVFRNVTLSVDAISYLSKIVRDNASTPRFPKFRFEKCTWIDDMNKTNNISSVNLLSDHFPYRATFISSCTETMSDDDDGTESSCAKRALRVCHDLAARTRIGMNEFRCLDLQHYNEAITYMPQMMKEFDGHDLVPVVVKRFSLENLYSIRGDAAEGVQSIEYCDGKFRVHNTELLKVGNLGHLQQILMFDKVKILSFSIREVLLADLPAMFECTPMGERIRNGTLRVEFASCDFSSDERLHYPLSQKSIPIWLYNNSIEIPSYGQLDGHANDSKYQETIMKLITRHFPFKHASELVLRGSGFDMKVIASNLINSHFTKLNLRLNPSMKLNQELCLLAALKSNKSIIELEVDGKPGLSAHGLYALSRILETSNTTMKNFTLCAYPRHFQKTERVDYFLGLNKIQRHELVKADLNPLLFPNVLEKSESNASVVYWILQTFPNLFLSCNMTSNQQVCDDYDNNIPKKRKFSQRDIRQYSFCQEEKKNKIS